MRFETLRELYLHSIDSFGPRPCFSMYGGESLTYAEFSERVNTLIDIFVHAGLNSGDKIALLSNNMPNWGVAYFAATVSGMVIVPILPDFSGPELDKIILHSEAKALVVSDKLFTKVSKEVISGLNLVVRSMNLGVIHQTSDTLGSVTIPNGDDLAAIIYTSGTTSSPKGVMLSHRNLCSELEMVSILQPVYPDDVFLSILPLSHTYECSLGMLLPVMWGASVVYLDKAPTASVLLPVLKKVRPTIMLTVPLAIAGALVFMAANGQTMNIFSQIGIIMLIGLVAKNGILIVEFANQKQDAGLNKREAIEQASLQRLRPILMTSASTILGLLPLTVASGEGAQGRIAMGIAVVGGMVVSTLLTLYIVPAIYSYVSTDRIRKTKKNAK